VSSQPNASLRGSAVALFLFDICENPANELRSILGAPLGRYEARGGGQSSFERLGG
jgi:hypothetical protein